ncbi:RidA family protein [Glutamicibacter sp. FBE19]|uniref:RidA family protein n=1 Tax=Glutamicibacter sp. FBE19 TaxID=2761534 RepID=UPI0018968EA5|nr:RidA family protein [Glutamicibacter sp. FBE19]MBF6670493.1 RidA family protein [Glutamicibacter sp. FBE19]
MYQTAQHPYSEIRFAGEGTAYVSGVLPYKEDGSIDRDVATAPQRILDVLGQRLAGQGMSLADVVKTTVFVTDISLRDAMNEAYLATFASPMPTRTIVEVRALPQDSPVEIEAIAWRQPHGQA